MNIQIINASHHPLPGYQTDHAAGMDVQAFLPDGSLSLAPGQRVAVPTGLSVAIPPGYEIQVRSRSGLSLKHGIVCINSPGTIDADYRGEIKVLLANLSDESYQIADGDRIAQIVVAKHERTQWNMVDSLDETTRGNGGFGHTGK